MRDEAVVYGIETCDQVRKARAWLRSRQVPFRFHDFRTQGLDAQMMARWTARLPWDALLNRRGLTWRQLEAARRATVVDQSSAVELMLSQPMLVKRPGLDAGDRILVGFSEPVYRTLFLAGDEVPAALRP
jgi:Spx/MgsR family transcriptional regulator